jgi:predicted NBD/HSP70 family sugar kinase
VSHRTLYLQLNRQFASRAASLSLREPESHLDQALLAFVASLATLANFANASVVYLAGKILDHVVEKGIGKAEEALKPYVASIRATYRAEKARASTDPRSSDRLVAEADTALEPYFEVLPSVNPPVLEAAFQAGRDAAHRYLQDLGLPDDDARFLSSAVESEIRAAMARRPTAGS